jgi:hypothetical protein
MEPKARGMKFERLKRKQAIPGNWLPVTGNLKPVTEPKNIKARIKN